MVQARQRYTPAFDTDAAKVPDTVLAARLLVSDTALFGVLVSDTIVSVRNGGGSDGQRYTLVFDKTR